MVRSRYVPFGNYLHIESLLKSLVEAGLSRVLECVCISNVEALAITIRLGCEGVLERNGRGITRAGRLPGHHSR